MRDALTGETFDIRAKLTLIAAGPWADLVLEHATGKPAHHKLLRSKGIHLLLPQISRAALTVEAGSGHFFVLPWRGHTLLGTTDTEFRGDPGTRRGQRKRYRRFSGAGEPLSAVGATDARTGGIFLCRAAAAGG